MSEPITISGVGILAMLKSLFPSFIGACLAVWYKRGSVDWSILSPSQKVFLTLTVLGAMMVGIFTSHVLGGAIIEYFKVVPDSLYADCVKGAIGLSSLKIIDSAMSNTDNVLNVLSEGLISKLKKWLG